MSSNLKFKTQNSKLQKLTSFCWIGSPANARDLPWRRTRDPYAIWVSEIMLQQTQVKTVIPFWKRWMRELPTIEAAANASPDKIHKLWEGLGYYTRVRNLQKAAKQIMEKHGGQFPENFDDVLALPGIGRYTAGAICSIAFNQPTPDSGRQCHPRADADFRHCGKSAGKENQRAALAAGGRIGDSRKGAKHANQRQGQRAALSGRRSAASPPKSSWPLTKLFLFFFKSISDGTRRAGLHPAKSTVSGLPGEKTLRRFPGKSCG